MSNFEEFLAFMARRRAEESAEEKSELVGVTTSDNKEVPGHCFNSVKMILAGCSNSKITDLGMDDFFVRLAKNFIKANTEEDIKHFVDHFIALRLTNIIKRL